MSSAIIDISWLINRARVFAGQMVTGQVDFKDEDFVNLLEQETLPTLSIYLPWYDDVVVDTVADRLDPQQEGVYQIRTPDRLIGIHRLRDGVGAFGAFPYDPLMFGDVVDRQLVSDRASATELSITWKFKAPNIVETFPKGITYPKITFEAKKVHPTHLRTVPLGARESLRELFLADLATDLMSVRSYFQGLQSAFGDVNLNLDRLQTQADKRESIIERLERLQLKSGQHQRIWIA